MRLIRTIFCCCWNIINAALFFVLLLQIAVGIGLWWLNSNHSRTFLKTKVNTFLQEHGLRADWNAVEIEWDGRIYFKNLSVEIIKERELQLNVDNLLVNLDILALLTGNPYPHKITYDFANLNMGTSGSVKELELLLRLTGPVSYTSGRLLWQNPALLLDGLPLRVDESIAVPIPLTKSLRDESEDDSLQTFAQGGLYEYLSGARRTLASYLEHIDQPMLQIPFLRFEENRLVVPFLFSADAVGYEDWRVQAPVVQGLVTLDIAGGKLTPGKIVFGLDGMQYGDALKTGPSAGTLYHKGGQQDWHFETYMSKATGKIGDYPAAIVQPTFLSGRYTSNADIQLLAATTLNGQDLVLDARLMGDEVRFIVDARLYPQPLIPLVWEALKQEPLPLLDPMQLTDPIRVSIDGSWMRESHQWAADFSVATRNVSYSTLSASELLVGGRVEQGHLRHAHAMAAMEDSQAYATWVHENPKEWFTLQIEGFIVPRDINPVMMSWWEHVFQRIEIFDPSTYTNVSYSAESFDSMNSEVLCYINGKSAFYCGYQLTDVQLSIWRRPGFLRLMDVSGHVDGGYLSGEVGWLYPHITGDESTVNTFAIETDYAGPAWQTIAEEVWEVLQELPITGTPQISIDAKLTESPDFVSDRVEALARVAIPDGTLTVEGLPLQAPRFTVSIPDNGQVNVSIDYAELAKGALTGTFDYENATRMATADLKLEKASYAAMQHTLASLGNEPSTVPLDSPGTIDFTALGKFPIDDLAAIQGQGTVKVVGAELQTIRMLGGLSRALERIGLNATTIRFTDAVAVFTMGEDKMQFSKLDLTGTNNRLEATGSYHLRKKTMDMALQLFLLSENQGLVKAIVGGIMRPITFATRIRLMGTLKEPEWRLLLDPRNLFTQNANEVQAEAIPVTPVAPAAE